MRQGLFYALGFHRREASDTTHPCPYRPALLRFSPDPHVFTHFPEHRPLESSIQRATIHHTLLGVKTFGFNSDTARYDSVVVLQRFSFGMVAAPEPPSPSNTGALAWSCKDSGFTQISSIIHYGVSIPVEKPSDAQVALMCLLCLLCQIFLALRRCCRRSQ